MDTHKKVEDYYPITVRTTPEGDVQKFITTADIEQYTKPKDLQSLYDHLTGSTRYLEGVYLVDVEQWLNRKEVI
jgi:hypothetical protein